MLCEERMQQGLMRRIRIKREEKISPTIGVQNEEYEWNIAYSVTL